jgi:hypothetical protein
VFILPGGDRWENSPIEVELAETLQSLDAKGVPLAAICGATLAISRMGLLRGRRHTSNGLSYLQAQVPGYAEAANYVDAPAVRDRGLITASGLGDVEFARELFEELGVLSAEDRALWATIFDDSQRYYELLLERVGIMVRDGKSLDQIKRELRMPEYGDWSYQERMPTNIEAAYRAVNGK